NKVSDTAPAPIAKQQPGAIAGLAEKGRENEIFAQPLHTKSSVETRRASTGTVSKDDANKASQVTPSESAVKKGMMDGLFSAVRIGKRQVESKKQDKNLQNQNQSRQQQLAAVLAVQPQQQQPQQPQQPQQ